MKKLLTALNSRAAQLCRLSADRRAHGCGRLCWLIEWTAALTLHSQEGALLANHSRGQTPAGRALTHSQASLPPPPPPPLRSRRPKLVERALQLEQGQASARGAFKSDPINSSSQICSPQPQNSPPLLPLLLFPIPVRAWPRKLGGTTCCFSARASSLHCARVRLENTFQRQPFRGAGESPFAWAALRLLAILVNASC